VRRIVLLPRLDRCTALLGSKSISVDVVPPRPRRFLPHFSLSREAAHECMPYGAQAASLSMDQLRPCRIVGCAYLSMANGAMPSARSPH